MAFQLNINSVDLSDQMVARSLDVDDNLNELVNICTFRLQKVAGETKPLEGQSIEVIDANSVKRFAGYLSRCKETEVGVANMLIYDVTAIDYTEILKRKKVAETYADQTLKQIVEHIVANYIDAGLSVTTNNTETGPTIKSVKFNYLSPEKCFGKLSRLTNFSWYIDYYKDIHFFSKEGNAAPEQLTDDTKNWRDLIITPDISQLRNRIVVRGGKYLSAQQTQTYKGDGTRSVWWLKAKPKTLTIKEGGVDKTVGVENLEDEAGNDYMVNYQEKSVRRVAGALGDGIELECKFYYYVRVLVEGEDLDSITTMKALTGGDGIYEHFINDKAIKSKEEGRDRAKAELVDYADPLINGRFITTTSALRSGSLFRSGQLLTINIPTRSIDNTYLIQRVVTRMAADEVNFEYIVYFGGRLLGLIDFLKELATREIEVDADEVIDKLKTIREKVNITDVVTKATPHTINEAVTIGENVRHNPFNPPTWVLAPYVPANDADPKRQGRLSISMYLGPA